MAKAPNAPLLDLPVELPDGRTGVVTRIYGAGPTAPERAGVTIDGASGRAAFTIVPTADLKVKR